MIHILELIEVYLLTQILLFFDIQHENERGMLSSGIQGMIISRQIQLVEVQYNYTMSLDIF